MPKINPSSAIRIKLAAHLKRTLGIDVLPEKIMPSRGGNYDIKVWIHASNNADYISVYTLTELLRAPELFIQGRREIVIK